MVEGPGSLQVDLKHGVLLQHEGSHHAHRGHSSYIPLAIHLCLVGTISFHSFGVSSTSALQDQGRANALNKLGLRSCFCGKGKGSEAAISLIRPELLVRL